MKKILLLTLGISSFSNVSRACDLCSIYMNLEPNDLKNSLGMNYRYRLFEHNVVESNSFNSRDKHSIGNSILNESLSQKEVFRSYDLWANYFINEKWMLSGNLTFVDNSYYENDSLLYNLSGPGDLNIVAKHIVYNSRSDDTNKLLLRWLVGGGIKVPVGTFNKTYTVTPSTTSKGNTVYGTPYEELDPHMQGGTGSWDALIVTEFLVRYESVGTSGNISYRISTKNSNQFRFANRFNWNQSAFYLIGIQKSTIAPSIGLAFESSRRDQLNNEDYRPSGGQVLFATYGAKSYLGSFAFGFTFFDPIHQHLNDNQLPNQHRMVGDLTYYF